MIRLSHGMACHISTSSSSLNHGLIISHERNAAEAGCFRILRLARGEQASNPQYLLRPFNWFAMVTMNLLLVHRASTAPSLCKVFLLLYFWLWLLERIMKALAVQRFPASQPSLLPFLLLLLFRLLLLLLAAWILLLNKLLHLSFDLPT